MPRVRRTEKKKLDLTEKPVNQLRTGRMRFPDRCDDRRDSVTQRPLRWEVRQRFGGFP